MDCQNGGAGRHLRARHRSAHGGKGGPKTRAIGPSRRGQTTKIHVLTDVPVRPGVVHLAPGDSGDVKAAPGVLAAAPGRLRRLVADRGYDADAPRHGPRAKCTKPVIPGGRRRKRPIRRDGVRCRDRWLIEAAICRLKDFRRVAARYDKLAADSASAIALAAVVAFRCRSGQCLIGHRSCVPRSPASPDRSP